MSVRVPSRKEQNVYWLLDLDIGRIIADRIENNYPDHPDYLGPTSHGTRNRSSDDCSRIYKIKVWRIFLVVVRHFENVIKPIGGNILPWIKARCYVYYYNFLIGNLKQTWTLRHRLNFEINIHVYLIVKIILKIFKLNFWDLIFCLLQIIMFIPNTEF